MTTKTPFQPYYYVLLIIICIGWWACTPSGLVTAPKSDLPKNPLKVIDFHQELKNLVAGRDKKNTDPEQLYKDAINGKDSTCIKEIDSGGALICKYFEECPVPVGDIAELREVLCEYINCGVRIDSLIIIGHGKPGKIAVGGGLKALKEDDPTRLITGNKSDFWWGQLGEKLKSALREDASVVLLGCEVGANDTMMHCLADSLKRTVIAPKGLVRKDQDINSLDSTKVNRVLPNTPITDPTSTSETHRNTAEELGGLMPPSRQPPFPRNIIGMGIYPSNFENIPSFCDNTIEDLPIANIGFIQSIFEEGFNLERSFENSGGFLALPSSVWVVQYDDGSFDIAHGLFDNRIFSRNTEGNNVIHFTINEVGRALVNSAIDMSIN